MPLDKSTIRLLELKCGFLVNTPVGAERLAADIESVTGERLSVNTVKRLTGVIESDVKPRVFTLDLIARYLGFDSRLSLEIYIGYGSSSFGKTGKITDVSRLAPGKRLLLAWAPGRRVVLEHLGDTRCRVVESENSKLLAGDLLTLRQVAPGFPLLVADVERNGEDLGPYSAARETGLSRAEVLRSKP